MRVSASTLSPALLHVVFFPGPTARALGAVGSARDEGTGQGPTGGSAGGARCQAPGAPSVYMLLAPPRGPRVGGTGRGAWKASAGPSSSQP